MTISIRVFRMGHLLVPVPVPPARSRASALSIDIENHNQYGVNPKLARPRNRSAAGPLRGPE